MAGSSTIFSVPGMNARSMPSGSTENLCATKSLFLIASLTGSPAAARRSTGSKRAPFISSRTVPNLSAATTDSIPA